jgi:hypothetical protein
MLIACPRFAYYTHYTGIVLRGAETVTKMSNFSYIRPHFTFCLQPPGTNETIDAYSDQHSGQRLQPDESFSQGI